jgi:hypothetical protein
LATINTLRGGEWAVDIWSILQLLCYWKKRNNTSAAAAAERKILSDTTLTTVKFHSFA